MSIAPKATQRIPSPIGTKILSNWPSDTQIQQAMAQFLAQASSTATAGKK